MSNVYVIGEHGNSEPMKRIHCKNESKELQSILEKNYDLLPSDQINPEDPRRWLLIKREMPVPDPNTGANRWSIDFFFVDQDAIPTFVECKRFNDTRSRREIVGQTLEYAANGQYYWTKDMIESFAEETARQTDHSLDESLRSLMPSDEESPDAFFEKVEENLREGQIRIVFFLEDSPMELRSVVDFLNKQMERSEVLLVEARFYEKGANKIVVPTLFGYTEEARRVKRSVTISKGGSRRKWDKTSFFEDAASKISSQTLQAIEKIYDFCESTDYLIKYGTGYRKGSISGIYFPACPRSIFTIWSNGSLALNFGWINGSEAAEIMRDNFKDLITRHIDLELPEDYHSKFLSYSDDIWDKHVDNFIEVLRELLQAMKTEMEKE